jgi:ribosomal protein S18 acetylase RimI-like enzyme
MSANREWSDLAERTEAAAMRRILDDQTPEVRDLLGMSTHAVGDGVHTVVVRDPMWGYWNKALGFCEPVTDDIVGAVADRCRDLAATVAALLVQPRVVLDDWSSITERHGLTPGTVMVKCFGPAEPRPVETDLRITRLTPEHAADFVRIMAVGFGFEQTPDADAMFAGEQFFDGDWATYGAWDGDALVGVARMLAVAETEAVALFGAATLPQGRNRGAQGALLDVRVREARDRGLRWASAETWLESTENQNPSQHNLRRAGLTEVHTRPNWVWRPE